MFEQSKKIDGEGWLFREWWAKWYNSSSTLNWDSGRFQLSSIWGILIMKYKGPKEQTLVGTSIRKCLAHFVVTAFIQISAQPRITAHLE